MENQSEVVEVLGKKYTIEEVKREIAKNEKEIQDLERAIEESRNLERANEEELKRVRTLIAQEMLRMNPAKFRKAKAECSKWMWEGLVSVEPALKDRLAKVTSKERKRARRVIKVAA